MPIQKTESAKKSLSATKDTLLFKENPNVTQNLKSRGLPHCKVCGSGFRTDLEGKKFCPNHKKDCPMLLM